MAKRLALRISFVLVACLVVGIGVLLFYNPSPSPVAPSAIQISQAQAAILGDETARPAGWRWERLQTLQHRFVRIGSASADHYAVVVYIPGFTSMAEQYLPAVRRLSDAGFDVATIDLPGQGGSSRLLPDDQKAWVPSFEVYIADVVVALTEIRRRKPNRQIILVGESLGGHVALRVAQETPGIIDRLVLVAPALRADTAGLPTWLVRSVTNIKTALGYGTDWALGQGPQRFSLDRRRSDCGGDAERMELYNAWNTTTPSQRVGGATHQWVAEFLRSQDVIASRRNFNSFVGPVLLVSPQVDTFTSAAFNERLCAESENCELFAIPKGHHCPWFDSDPIPGVLATRVASFVAANN